MKSGQHMHTVAGGTGMDKVAIIVPALLIILCPHTADHKLERPGKVVHGKDIVLDVVIDILHLPEIASIQGEVTAQSVVPFHVIDTAPGSAEENHVRVQPVDIKVVTIETFTRP